MIFGTRLAFRSARMDGFFRQSGWLMLATVASGLLMFCVHPLARLIGKAEYGLFGTLLMVVMLVPSGSLQKVLAQQTAGALATHRERELAGIIRATCFGMILLWMIAASLVFMFQGWILRLWGIENPAALWLTLLVVLLSLLAPVFLGVVQGQQNFLWLGWIFVGSAVGRVVFAAALVLVLSKSATGMLGGVLAGVAMSLIVGVWQTRSLWRLEPAPFDWSGLLRQAIPLLLGFVFFQFLLIGDTLFVRHYFTAAVTGPYVAAGTLSRAVLWLVIPFASVMFPRIVHSVTRMEKTDVLGVGLLGAAVMTLAGAAAVILCGPWIVKLVFGPGFAGVAARVLPWYALAMVPLAFSNVLVNNLLARFEFRVVPLLLALAVGYAATLVSVNHAAHSLIAVLQVLGAFSLLLLAVCSWFTWNESLRSALWRMAHFVRSSRNTPTS